MARIKGTTTTVTSRNRVTVPDVIARPYRLAAGSKLDWHPGAEPGVIVVQVQLNRAQMVERIKEIGKGLKHRNLVRRLLRERALETL